MRKFLLPGFSERTIRDQEDVIKSFTDLLVRKLKEKQNERKGANLRDCYSWTTTDIIGHLVFAEPFGALNDGGGHP